MTSLLDLLQADPGAWLRRAAAWDILSRDLSDRADDLDRALPEGWTGADADRARAARDELCRAMRADAATGARAAEVLDRHAGEVLHAQRTVVVAALGVHPALGADLRTGSISIAGGVLSALVHVPASAFDGRLLSDVVRFGRSVAAALEAAIRSDATADAQLRALHTGRASAPTPHEVPVGATAAHAWWTGLPAGERDLLIRTRPELVGGTDGLPVADRNRANRRRLDAEEDRLREAVVRQRRFDDRGGAARTEVALAGLRALRRRLDAGGAALLDIGGGPGNGRVVLAVGDVERAGHVVTHVTGTASGWTTAPEDLRRTEATRAAARAAAPGSDVAGVLWIGYDAPPGLLAATSDGPARRGAASLRAFQDGLRAGHDGPVHLTVVGHSYGSTVVGHAAARPGLAAHDVVFVGSPGVGVSRADELAVPRVWATTARHDPVGQVPGVDLFATSRGFEPSGLVLGANPAGPGFGARVFPSAPGSLLPGPDDPATPTDESAFAAAHGAYWDPGSPSLRSLGAIVSGTAE